MDRRLKRNGRACSIATSACLVLTALVVGGTSAPALAYTVPAATTSIYENDASTSNLFSQGKYAGSHGQHGVVYLDFGRAAYNGSSYGTIDFGGHFDKFADIEAAADQYAWGYESAAPSGNTMDIAIAINNSCTYHSWCFGKTCSVTTTCSNLVPSGSYTTFGSRWADRVNNLANYIASPPAWTNEYGDGADDAEPGFDPPYTNTHDVLSGFSAEAQQNVAVGDFGSLDGGPGASVWTTAQQYQVAYGFGADYPAGEIYTSAMASQWTALAKWTWQNKGFNLFIEVVTSENGYGGTYTTSQSYNTLETDLSNCNCGEAPSGATKIPDTTNI